MDSRTIPPPPRNPMGGEVFTITERRATKRQDGTWYFETVRVEKTALA